MTQDLISSSQKIKKFLPKGSTIIITDNSNIILIVDGRSTNTLERIAAIVKARDSQMKAFGKTEVITKDDAQTIANVLNEQSKRLEGLSVSYRIMATALLASKDNFVEVVETNDPYIKDVLNNPFE